MILIECVVYEDATSLYVVVPTLKYLVMYTLKHSLLHCDTESDKDWT